MEGVFPTHHHFYGVRGAFAWKIASLICCVLLGVTRRRAAEASFPYPAVAESSPVAALPWLPIPPQRSNPATKTWKGVGKSRSDGPPCNETSSAITILTSEESMSPYPNDVQRSCAPEQDGSHDRVTTNP